MKIFIGIPCVSYKLYSGTVNSLLNLDRLLKNENYDVEIHIENGISIVDHARNKLITKFINSNCEYILFIDDDIEFDPLNILKMIRLNCDVIGGIYPNKCYNWEKIIDASRIIQNEPNIIGDKIRNFGINYMFKNPINNLQFNVSEEPIEVEGVGTGCLLISKNAIEKMKNEKYKLNGNEYYRIFSISIENEEYVSEDYNFCNKWREIGGKIYIATFNKCNHWGIHKF